MSRDTGPLAVWLEGLREKRDKIARQVEEGRRLLDERLAALGRSGFFGRDIPENVRAEQRWVERDESDLRRLERVIASVEQRVTRGDGASGPYRESEDGAMEMLGRVTAEREALAAKIAETERALLARYIAAKVPMRPLPGAGDGFLILGLLAAGAVVFSFLVRSPIFGLIYAAFLGVLVLVAWLQERRKKPARVELWHFDRAKAPAKLRAEQSALEARAVRLRELEKEIDDLESVLHEEKA